jgi:electron transport complex protein RnfC
MLSNILSIFSSNKNNSFTHGIHPHGNKEQTEDLPIQRMPFGKRYVMPLNQHIGAPAKAIVKVGEEVQRGQLIAKAGGFVSTSLHSPVVGKVISIGQHRYPGGKFAEAIEIEADVYASQKIQEKEAIDWQNQSIEEFINHVQDAGIVGLGGAAFPSHVKYSIPDGKKIKYLVVNGAECEPYLTNDYRLMIEQPEALIQGTEIIRQKLNAEEAIIGVELNKPEAIETLKKHIRPEQRIKVVGLTVKYPQGAEKMLIQALLDLYIEPNQLPRDVGVAVNNVGTVIAIADYYNIGMPLVERVVTVSGSGIANPANLLVPLGTPIRDVLEFCGGLKSATKSVIMGGPMMGTPIASLDAPIIKGSSGILAFTEEESATPTEFPCISCGRCVEACPYFLNPSRLARLAKVNDFEGMDEYFVMDCVECGSCTYSCPSGIPIVQLIRVGKNILRSKK